MVEHFKDHPEVKTMYSYKLLERVLKEQCNLLDDGHGVEVKRPKEISSDSLQNPSDPDATYSGHKGQGYQVQVMETYGKEEEAKEERLNLITHIEVQPAHESDANALIPAIESSQKRGLGPEEVLADTLYGSDENSQRAEELGVEVVSPAKSGKEKADSIHLSDFTVSEKGDVSSCPQGHVPVHTKTKKTRHTAAFDSQHCSACPFQQICPVKQGKKYHYLRYTDKDVRLARRRAYEQTEDFKDRYRWCSGVEASMSEYDRRTGVKHLRVRGLKAVRFSATLKALGINIFRTAAVRKAVNNRKADPAGILSAPIYLYYVVKERFLKTWSSWRKFIALFVCRYVYHPIISA
ncbi:MAG: transposase [Deltaproteobacteria bacterium]|nr:transposase [Deltaproteobacteria bacterium]